MESILHVDHIEKSYSEFHLDAVSFDVEAGAIVGIIGPNGAGKTTTLKIIMNMILADHGTVSVFGLDHTAHERTVKNRIGYVGEEQIFYEDKSVAWTGKFIGSFYDSWDVNVFSGYLSEFGISSTKKIKDLSKGMKVKLGLALALSHNPELIILDEPTSGLDPVIRRELLDKLRRLVTTDQSKSVLISSHITDDISRTADYIIYLVDGKIATVQAKDDLLAAWKRIHYKTGAIDPQTESRLKMVESSIFGSSGITDRYEELSPLIAEAVRAGDVKVENVDLDDILLCYVKGQ